MRASLGGGYFLQIAGKGIVIDPGFNFIEIFKNAGHYFAEINTVILSHAHNDHTADLESILTLLNKYNSEIKSSDDERKNTIRKEVVEKEREKALKTPNEKPQPSIDELVEKAYLESPRRKVLHLYMPTSVYLKYSSLLPLKTNADYVVHVVEKHHFFDMQDITKLHILDAKHDDLISDNCPIGFWLEVDGKCFIYTGDTGWSNTIEAQYRKVKKDTKNKEIVLLAHFGGINAKDNAPEEDGYLTAKSPSDYSCFYKKHLGRLGLCKLLSVLKPKLCIISEFGEEFLGHRQELAKIYQAQYQDTIILPADIDLKYYFNRRQAYVITNICLDPVKITRGDIPIENVAAYEATSRCSIYYHAPGVDPTHIVEAIAPKS